MSAVLDFPVKPEARDFLARFARDSREPGWLAARRQQAMTYSSVSQSARVWL